ncbi:MAG: DUF4296 domain-containing protein [Ferruginibacter sp.]
MRLLYIFFIFFLFACKKNDTASILPTNKMDMILWDFIKADVFTSTHLTAANADSMKKENVVLQKKIFAVHGISKEQFYKSFNYYSEHPQSMLIMLDTLTARENRLNAHRQTIIKHE